jgi:hypothetical protein
VWLRPFSRLWTSNSTPHKLMTDSADVDMRMDGAGRAHDMMRPAATTSPSTGDFWPLMRILRIVLPSLQQQPAVSNTTACRMAQAKGCSTRT